MKKIVIQVIWSIIGIFMSIIFHKTAFAFAIGMTWSFVFVLSDNIDAFVFKIKLVDGFYRVYYKGLLWNRQFDTINHAFEAIVYHCDDAQIRRYHIFSPDGKKMN